MDQEICKILKTLRDSAFYNDTIIIYTSDHGELLGSHGWLFQKWYQAYEEAIHIPMIIHNPMLTPQSKAINILTSHVDILPTLLGLAGINAREALDELKKNHTQAHTLVGRNLTPLILNDEESIYPDEPIYFMTDDDPSKNLKSETPLGLPVEPVAQPNHIETVISNLPTGINNKLEIWKYSRYFDNSQFLSSPKYEDKNSKKSCTISVCESTDCSMCITTIKTEPVLDEFEMYNLSIDPIESRNLANPAYATDKSTAIEVIMAKILDEQSQKKRLYPSNVNESSSQNHNTGFLNL